MKKTPKFTDVVNHVLGEMYKQGDIYNPTDKAEHYDKVQSTLNHLGMDGTALSEDEFNAQLRNKPFQSIVDFVKTKKQSGLKQVNPPSQNPAPAQTANAAAPQSQANQNMAQGTR